MLTALRNPVLMAGLRKIWQGEEEYWRALCKAEALRDSPNTNKIIHFTASESAAELQESIIREAVGL